MGRGSGTASDKCAVRLGESVGLEAAVMDGHDEDAQSRAASSASHLNRPQQDRSEDDVIEAEVEIALLDIEGTIVWVNNAWHEFARANGGDTERVGIGTSYLKACDGDTGNAAASQVASAIRSALAGDLPAPLTIRIPCDGPDQARWFDVLISSRADAAGALVGATVTLSP